MEKTFSTVEVGRMDKGYSRFNHPRLGKLYAGVVCGGFPRATRPLRWYFKRARDARAYAVKVAERWHLIFGQKAEE